MKNADQGHFEAKVLVKDLKRQKSFVLYMKSNAVFAKKLRADLISSLGGHVASLVLNGDEFRYIVVPQKKFFVGAAKPESLRSVLALPLNPRWFYNILFDRPFDDAAWECTNDDKGLVKECRHQKLNLQITWSERYGDKKTVLVEHEFGSLQMNFQNFKPQLDSHADLFVLEAPAGFSKIK